MEPELQDVGTLGAEGLFSGTCRSSSSSSPCALRVHTSDWATIELNFDVGCCPTYSCSAQKKKCPETLFKEAAAACENSSHRKAEKRSKQGKHCWSEKRPSEVTSLPKFRRFGGSKKSLSRARPVLLRTVYNAKRQIRSYEW